MELVARFCWCAMLQMLNWSIYLGMALAALLALRPMTRRLLEPRQRVALWGVVWLSFCLPQWINLLDRVPLPFTLRSFLTPRTYCDSGFDHFPMYLPEITGEGTYHLALPGGFSIPIQVSWQGMVLLVLLGAAYFVVIFSLARWSDRGVGKLASQGRALETEDYERLGLTMAEGQSIKLCPDLPTSFVLRRKGGHDILLQRELTGEQMKLVLIHEREHVKQRHPWLQGIASAVWILNFWNPLVWLAYRAFRLDMELACDQGVLEQLDVEGRRSYARTLVELASVQYGVGLPPSASVTQPSVSGRLPTGSPITEAPGRGRHGAGTGKRSWAGQRPPPWLPFFWQGAPTVPWMPMSWM